MSLQTKKKGELSVSGDLNFESVAVVYTQAHSILQEYSGTIDLAEVGAVDSAGLALLLEWQAAAKAHGASLAFVNAPSDLRRLAVLSGSIQLLDLAARPHADGKE